MTRRVALLRRVDDRLLAAYPDIYGSDSASRCASLAEALSTSPAWHRVRGTGRLVVRPDEGLIALIGPVEEPDAILYEAFGWHVDMLLDRLRPVRWPDVVDAALDLSEQLRARLSLDELRACHLLGIPRGGLVVAGLVAAALGIEGGRVGSAAPGGVTILVDDCALGGTRLRQSIRSLGGDLLIGLLHAHPDLCSAIESRESRVRACLAARSLEDHARARDDDAWRDRWAERSPDDYWTGDPDHVCYPWNEPDAVLWNPVSARVEGGWRVVPPGWCVKNRGDAVDGDVQRCDMGPGPWRPAAGVVWASFDDGVVLAREGQSGAIALRGSGASLWLALARAGTPEALAQAVALDHGVDAATARRDVDTFGGRLSERGLLVAG